MGHIVLISIFVFARVVHSADTCIDDSFSLAQGFMKRSKTNAISDPAADMQSPIPHWILPGNVEYPVMALNTASLSIEDVEGAVKLANQKGIRNVDFHASENEVQGVARALSTLGREALFLVTKVDKPPADMTDPAAAAKLAQETVDQVINNLTVAYIDVFLLKDSATCAVMQAQWAVLKNEMKKGRIRALGTYNYCQFALDCILRSAKTPPALNYIMRHPGMRADANWLTAYCKAKGVQAVAYGTLGEPAPLSELLSTPQLMQIAKKHGRTPEEVALRWNVQSGYAISSRPNAGYNLTASFCTDTCSKGIIAMSSVYSWTLSSEEIEQIDAILYENPAVPAQPPTYYASKGCPSFNFEEAKKRHSPCMLDMSSSAWC
jgi:diketogulonate reductase-like aldo/keto reductase